MIFEDMAMCLSEQELASLTVDQKALYKEVVLENFAHVAFLGKVSALLLSACSLSILRLKHLLTVICQFQMANALACSVTYCLR